MPTVNLNKKVFEKLVGKKLPIEKLKDRISMIGTDLEDIKGEEITVEVFPNRPDMLSEQGFARAFSSFIGVKTGFRKFDVKKTKDKVIVENLPKEWPYCVACIVRGLKFNDENIREVIQLQEKLDTTLTRNRRKGGIGLYPVEKVKFPITFVGRKPEDIKFRPLEFPSEINAKKILSAHPKGREYGHLMDGWDKYPIFIDDNAVIMSMPPIINSHDVGKIDETTTDVFVEATGIDMNTVKIALNILVTSLADMGGKIESLEIEYPNEKFTFPDLSGREMKLDINYVNKLLGMDFKENEIKKLLERMGYGYTIGGKVLVPAYRADIMHQMDLVEDIAIAYGYENFEEELPNVTTTGEIDAFENFKKKVSDILVGLGLIEVYTNHVTNRDIQCKKMNVEIPLIEIQNSMSEEFDVLRAWMIPSLMEVLHNNLHNEYPQNIFDIGTVFKEDKSAEPGTMEAERLAVLLCGEDVNYTKILQVLQYLMQMVDVKFKIKDIDHDSFIKGRVGRVSVGDGNKAKDVAYIGEIHPKVLGNFELEMPVVGLELNLTDLFEAMHS